MLEIELPEEWRKRWLDRAKALDLEATEAHRKQPHCYESGHHSGKAQGIRDVLNSMIHPQQNVP